jgi:hypothetical protein
MDDKVLDLSERLRQKEGQAEMDRQLKLQKFSEVANYANQIFFNVVSRDFQSLSTVDFDEVSKLAYKAARSISSTFMSEAKEEGLL